MKKKYFITLIFVGAISVGITTNILAASRCSHRCVFGAACDSTTDPCNNHTAGMDCWRCTEDTGTSLCVPMDDWACSMIGDQSQNPCGEMWKGTCGGGPPLECSTGINVGKCERELCSGAIH